MRRAGVYIFLVLLITIGFWRWGKREELKLFEKSRILMDTVVTISLYERDETHSLEAMEIGFGELERMEGVMSAYRQGSEVWKINQAAGDSSVPVGRGLFYLISRALRFSRLTQGAFDPTIFPLEGVWGFPTGRYRVPRKGEIDTLLALVGYWRIKLDSLQQRVALPLRGEGIDLGGVAKGYAVDRVAELLEGMGVPGGVVNAGGDIRFWGVKPDGKLWRVAVRHPRQPGRFIGYLNIPAQGVATSGDYERCFFHQGKRYHHLLDPITGFPADSSVSVTVVAPTAEEADILATGVFVLGPREGRKLLEALPGVEGIIFYERDGALRFCLTEGMRKIYSSSGGNL